MYPPSRILTGINRALNEKIKIKKPCLSLLLVSPVVFLSLFIKWYNFVCLQPPYLKRMNPTTIYLVSTMPRHLRSTFPTSSYLMSHPICLTDDDTESQRSLTPCTYKQGSSLIKEKVLRLKVGFPGCSMLFQEKWGQGGEDKASLLFCGRELGSGLLQGAGFCVFPFSSLHSGPSPPGQSSASLLTSSRKPVHQPPPLGTHGCPWSAGVPHLWGTLCICSQPWPMVCHRLDFGDISNFLPPE